MKNIFKLFGIIASVAVIGFSVTACDTNGDNHGDNWTRLTAGTGTWEKGGVEPITIGFFEEDGQRMFSVLSSFIRLFNSSNFIDHNITSLIKIVTS
jgi:hypothetical protein